MKTSAFVGTCVSLAIGAAVVLSANAARAEATVVYVAPDATGGDGSSWDSPTTFEAAMAALGTKGSATYEAEVEIWLKEGVYAKTEDSATYTIPAKGSVAIRGGFAGTEANAADRADGSCSTIDGADAYKTFVVNNTGALEIDRMVFMRSSERGISKTGSGSLTMRDCRSTANGATADAAGATGIYGPSLAGRGAYIEGNANVTTVKVENCLFDGNIDKKMWYRAGEGYGMFLMNLKNAEIVNCSFVTNGNAFATTSSSAQSSTTTFVAENVKLAMTNCSFVANTAFMGSSGAVATLRKNCDGSTIDHCVWKGNRVMKGTGNDEIKGAGNGLGLLTVSLDDMSRAVDITGCTFAYNICSSTYCAGGLNVMSGTANVRDSIFYGNVISTRSVSGENDVMVTTAKGTVNLSYTLLDHVPATAACDNLVVGTPDFVTPIEDFLACIDATDATYPQVDLDVRKMNFKTDETTLEKLLNLDVHCKSTAGYYKNDGQLYTDATASSRAVDAGDPESAFANEGSPNGGRVNLGVYGNTAEAAKSFVGHPTVSADDIQVEWLDGYTQPKVTVTVGGTDEFNATAEIYLSENGGEFEKVSASSGMRSGDSLEVVYPDWLTGGGPVVVKVVVKAYGVDDLVVTKSFEVGGTVPPWVGKGGDAAKVIHVREGATGRKDGTSWSAAYDSFADAMLAMTKDRNEIWIAGTNVLTKNMGAPSYGFAFAVRGGFDGSENSVEERKDGVVSGVDGALEYPTFVVNCSSTVTVERVLLTRSYYQGLKKTGNGNLVMKDCRLLSNGVANADRLDGRGVYVQGNSGVTEARIENCRIEGNTDEKYVNDAGYGFGLYLEGLKNAAIVDTLVMTNGYRVGIARKGSRTVAGGAMYAKNAKVAATNCQFVGNAVYSNGGAMMDFVENCDGSVFDHCLWAFNRDTRSSGYSETAGIGMFKVNMKEAAQTVSLESCTVAYNLSGATMGASGVNAMKGTVNIHNSILYGNMCPAANENDSEVMVHDAENAAINISWTLMDHAPMGDGITCANLTIGKPEFVTSLDAFLDCINVTDKDTQIAFPKVDVNQMDMRFKDEALTYETMANVDMHSLSRAGYYKNDGLRYKGAKTTSPAVDAGDPASDFRNEPGPNGHRVNLGFYGNTAEAALSAGGFVLTIR